MKNKGWLSAEKSIIELVKIKALHKRLIDMLFWLTVVKKDYFSFHTNTLKILLRVSISICFRLILII